MKTEFVNKECITHGDTILINGEMLTVDKKYIRNSPAYGLSIFGHTFRDNKFKVERVLFLKWYRGEIVSYQTQI